MKSIIKTIIVILIFTENIAVAESNSNLRYDGYIFSPVYENIVDEAFLKESILSNLKDWYEVAHLHAVPLHNNKYLVLNKVKVSDSKTLEHYKFVEHKYYVLKEKLNDNELSFWDSIDIIDENGVIKNHIKSFKDQNTLIARNIDGNRSDLLHGCIEKEPVFLAPLIQGESDFAFVVSGVGRGSTDLVNLDRISISVFSPSGEALFKENLLVNNFYASPAKVKDQSEDVTPQNRVGYKPYTEFPISDEFGRIKYTKMFVVDIDKDNLLEILFWNRTYKSPPVNIELNAKAKGFLFEEQSFVLYKEDSDSFEKLDISNEMAELLLKKNELTWEVGYPKEDELCDPVQVPLLWGAESFE